MRQSIQKSGCLTIQKVMKFFQQLGKINQTCQNAILDAFCAIYYSHWKCLMDFFILLRLLIIFTFTQSYSSMTSSGRVSKFRTRTNFVIKWNFPCGNEMFILSKLKIICSRFQSCHDWRPGLWRRLMDLIKPLWKIQLFIRSSLSLRLIRAAYLGLAQKTECV